MVPDVEESGESKILKEVRAAMKSWNQMAMIWGIINILTGILAVFGAALVATGRAVPALNLSTAGIAIFSGVMSGLVAFLGAKERKARYWMAHDYINDAYLRYSAQLPPLLPPPGGSVSSIPMETPAEDTKPKITAEPFRHPSTLEDLMIALAGARMILNRP